MFNKYDNTVPIVVKLKEWIKLTPTCWLWVGPAYDNGRGFISYNGRRQYAYRVIWQVYFGEIPPGMVVCHICDNPNCVRPAHLFLGTQRENLLDSIKKGRYNCDSRGSPGEKNGSAKLTASDVCSIRTLHQEGETITVLSSNYGVCERQIMNIIERKAWRHIA